MFPKKTATDYTNYTKMKFFICLILGILSATALSVGQEDLSNPPEDEEKEAFGTYDVLEADQDAEERDLDQDKGEYSIYDVMQTDESEEQELEIDDSQLPEQQPIPVPIMAGADNRIKSVGGQSLVDDVFINEQNRFGVSLSGYLAYTERLSGGHESDVSSAITAFMPRAFFNFGKRRSTFHIDFGAGYRHYHQNSELDNWDYYASANYTYQISRRASIGISDQFTSSYNDAWSFLSIYSPIYYDRLLSNEILFNRQRITRNSLSAAISYQTSSKSRLNAFGRYGIYKYSRNTLANADALEAGASFSYQFTEWLSLSNRYSLYIYGANEQFRDKRVHDLQIGNLNFNLGRNWRIWLGGGGAVANSGGVFSDQDDNIYFRPTGSAGIGYTSTDTDFSVTYQRQFTAAIGLSTLLMSDIISSRYGYRLTGWSNANLEAHYYRSSELDSDGELETFSGGGGLQFSLTRNLIASLNAAYQNQVSNRFSIPGLDIERISAYAGLHFVWPSRREGGRRP